MYEYCTRISFLFAAHHVHIMCLPTTTFEVLEDLVGEYVLNISKENLKLAALRGQIKLDNVELDGDVIGSYVLGAVGLSGFGVLSCWARTLKINIPYTNLDAPTSLEIHGMHLVCVPLLPTTANRTYYGGQTLQTKAKRSALARFERNYYSGRIPGEGPQQDSYPNDRTMHSFNGRRRRSFASEDLGGEEDDDGTDFDTTTEETARDGHEDTPSAKAKRKSRLPALRKKITAKIYENLVSSINDVHIRCEVPGGGLTMSSPSTMGNTGNTPSESDDDRRAFAFGLTLKCLSVRNMPEASLPDSGDVMSRFDQPRTRSMNTVDDGKKAFKKAEIEDLAMYWDDDPCYLISDSALLHGRLSLPVEACQRRIAEAMELMAMSQDPGFHARKSLSGPGFSAEDKRDDSTHDYICSKISQSMIITSASDSLGNSLCFREIPPFTIDLNITSHQYEQYQLLKNAVLSQQRFDTMLHRRPENSPLIASRAWWKYAIACVKHKPTSRSWDDVQRIVRCRQRYLQLAVKNLLSSTDKGGFHGGLTDDESRALSLLEYTLPIETLLSFHLLALRRVFAPRQVQTIGNKAPKRISRVDSFATKRSSSTLGRLYNSISGSTNSSKTVHEECVKEDERTTAFPENCNSQFILKPRRSSASRDNFASAQTVSISRDNFVTAQSASRLHMCRVRISLVDHVDRRKIITAEFDVGGTTYASGAGKADVTFDIKKFEVFDFVTCDYNTSGMKVLAIEPSNEDGFKCRNDFLVGNLGGSYMTSSARDIELDDAGMRLPPDGVACRITAFLDQISLSLEISSHPLTLVWNKICADRVSNFLLMKAHQIQHKFLQKLRNAATPIAQRAHMAVFYPNSLSVDIAVHAPKLWIPVSPQVLDGALFVDTGKLKMTLTKPEESTDTSWKLDVADIQIMLASDACEMQNVVADLDGMLRLRKKLATIVYPFEVSVAGHSNGSFQDHGMHLDQEVHSHESIFETQTDEGTGQIISVNVGHIRVNLIDVEVLAKAIGRFYVSGVGMMKHKSASRSECITAQDLYPPSQGLETSVLEVVHVCFEKVEAALERYSSKRTYVVELYLINLDKKNKGNLSFSRLSVSDFNIVQLIDVSSNQSGLAVRYLMPSCEPQHQVLGRRHLVIDEQVGGANATPPASPHLTAPRSPKIKRLPPSPLKTPTQLRSVSQHSPAPGSLPSEFISGCHFHDGGKHVDEVELDIASVILKVTPTSISDCTMWLARAIELISVASKEMERRVHERGRNARSEEHRGKLHIHSLLTSVSRHQTINLLAYHSFALKGSKDIINNITKINEGLSYPVLDAHNISGDGMLLDAKDSSVIFRITFSQATILVGRPASEFTWSRGRKPEDYVLQFKTNASIMTQSIENENDIGSSTLHVSLEDFSAAINPDFQHLDQPVSPILRPTSIDCRVVHDTFKGQASSQKVSFDCELMVWNLVSALMAVFGDRVQLRFTHHLFNFNVSVYAQHSCCDKRCQEGDGKTTIITSSLV